MSVDLHKSTPVQPNACRYKPRGFGMEIHLIYPLESTSIKLFTGMRHLSFSVFHIAVGPFMDLAPIGGKLTIAILRT